MKNPTTSSDMLKTIPVVVKALKAADFFFYSEKDTAKWGGFKEKLKDFEVPTAVIDDIEDLQSAMANRYKTRDLAYKLLHITLESWQQALVGQGLTFGNVKSLLKNHGDKAIQAFSSPLDYKIPGVDLSCLTHHSTFVNSDECASVKAPKEDWTKAGLTKDNAVDVLAWVSRFSELLAIKKPWDVMASTDADVQKKITALKELKGQDRDFIVRQWKAKWSLISRMTEVARQFSKNSDVLEKEILTGNMSSFILLLGLVKSKKAMEKPKAEEKKEESKKEESKKEESKKEESKVEDPKPSEATEASGPKVEDPKSASPEATAAAAMQAKIFSLLQDAERMSDKAAAEKLRDEAIELMRQSMS